MIGQPASVIRSEGQFYLSTVHQAEDLSGGQREMFSGHIIIDIQQVIIFLSHGEGAGASCGYDVHALGSGLSHCCHVGHPLSACFPWHAVGYLGHSTAFLSLEELNAISDGIHHLHKVLAQLRIVVVYITAMEETHLMREAPLLCGTILEKPLTESLRCILGHGSPLVYGHDTMHEHRLEERDGKHGVHYGSHLGGHCTHEISIAEEGFAQEGEWSPGAGIRSIPYACTLDDITYLHSLRACHFTTLAIEAHLECFVVIISGIFHAITLPIGTRLLRAGIPCGYSRYRTIYRTY